jgi:hypothetical protein
VRYPDTLGNRLRPLKKTHLTETDEAPIVFCRYFSETSTAARFNCPFSIYRAEISGGTVREQEMLLRRASRLRVELKAISDPLARNLLITLAQALEDTAARRALESLDELEGRSHKLALWGNRRV